MLRRKFYDYLLAWKAAKQQECLLVNGARQVGKTYIIDVFGKTAYKSYLYLNFLQHPEYRDIFSASLQPEEIYKRISLYLPDVHYIEHDTLIFLDEIQVCRRARTALKFLALDNRYDVIASGSLLRIHYREDDAKPEDDYSVPVGYEHEVELCALDFEEFLWARGISEEAVGYLKTLYLKKEKIDPGICLRYQAILKEYMITGGMPAVVNTLLATSNYQAVYQEQNKIFKAYEDDIEKYAKNTDKPKIKNCYYSIPRQLSKEYTKFQYKTVERNGSNRKYGNAIDWLIDAGLVKPVYNVALPMLPLKAYEKPDEFKIYLSDTGLAAAMFGFETQAALLNGTLTGPAKGGLYENLIFDMLMKRGFHLNYYKKDNNTQEIEFLFESHGFAVPVEVKAARGDTLSLNSFLAQYNPGYAYKLIDGNIGISGQKITLPHFMAMFLQ